MSFSQSSITRVEVQADGADLLITWDSTAPTGTTFQVYVDHRLTWFGSSRQCHAPIPVTSTGGTTWVDVGTVGDADTHVDFSPALLSQSRGGGVVELSWYGGTYLDPTGNDDLGGFRVYGPPGPGTDPDLSRPVADLAAYPGGWVSDGFGLGGFGKGGFGRAATGYSWTAGTLAGGSWRFRIVPYDLSGTERGDGQTVLVEANSAPRAPARGADGKRLWCDYTGPDSRLLRIRWLPSPSTS